MTMNRNDGGVDHGVFHIRVIRDRFEKLFEHPALGPIVKAFEDRVPVAEFFRKIPPRAACARLPKNGFQKQPVVGPTAARIAAFAKAMRFHLRPLPIRQNRANHSNLLKRKLESLFATFVNPDSQQTLD